MNANQRIWNRCTYLQLHTNREEFHSERNKAVETLTANGFPPDQTITDDEIMACLGWIVHNRVATKYSTRGINLAKCMIDQDEIDEWTPGYRRNSYGFKHDVERWVNNNADAELEARKGSEFLSDYTAWKETYIPAYAFSVAAVMAGVSAKYDVNGNHPCFKLGGEFAILGMRPEDHLTSYDRIRAEFWLWVIKKPQTVEFEDHFCHDAIRGLIYGDSVSQCDDDISNGCPEAKETYWQLFNEFISRDDVPLYALHRESVDGDGVSGPYREPFLKDIVHMMSSEELERLSEFEQDNKVQAIDD